MSDLGNKAKDAFELMALKRAQRLLQISGITLVGLLVASFAARGTTKPIIIAGAAGAAVSAWLAWRKQGLASATILLTDLMVMLSTLVWVSGGVHDIAMLGYPAVLVFAALLGSSALFKWLLFLILTYCSYIVVMTVQGSFQMVFPTMTYSHLVYVNVIFIVTGFSVYLLVRDMQRLMESLRDENQRVREREHTIVQLANQDQLTGLPNRRYAEEYFSDLVRQAKIKDQKLIVYFLDLDNFKPVNDSLGHAAGDILLRDLAKRLSHLAGPDDVLCRFGGDEFIWFKMVHYKNKNHKHIINQAAQDLLDAALQPFYIMENKVDISGSVGIALSPEHGNTFSDLCRAADLAMYHAKTKGRNTFSYYDEELNRVSIDKYQMLKRIREGMEQEEFQVWYQPKYRLSDRSIIGCEALIRWPQADGSFIRPDEFIPLAESSGLIAELGYWVLRRSCLDCATWRSQGFAIPVAVNVSYVQFRDGTLPKLVEQVLAESGLPANFLELELTESLLINDEDGIQKQLNSLTGMGVTLAIDDFGTGYSNLGYLRRFNASKLKIDKSFVTALGVSERDEPLVRAMVQMAHSLNLQTIAEGVETDDCAQKLIALGCDIGQGYLWSPAIALDKWLEYLHAHSKKQIVSLAHSQFR